MKRTNGAIAYLAYRDHMVERTGRHWPLWSEMTTLEQGAWNRVHDVIHARGVADEVKNQKELLITPDW